MYYKFEHNKLGTLRSYIFGEGTILLSLDDLSYMIDDRVSATEDFIIGDYLDAVVEIPDDQLLNYELVIVSVKNCSAKNAKEVLDWITNDIIPTMQRQLAVMYDIAKLDIYSTKLLTAYIELLKDSQKQRKYAVERAKDYERMYTEAIAVHNELVSSIKK